MEAPGRKKGSEKNTKLLFLILKHVKSYVVKAVNIYTKRKVYCTMQGIKPVKMNTYGE